MFLYNFMNRDFFSNDVLIRPFRRFIEDFKMIDENYSHVHSYIYCFKIVKDVVMQICCVFFHLSVVALRIFLFLSGLIL